MEGEGGSFRVPPRSGFFWAGGGEGEEDTSCAACATALCKFLYAFC